MRIDLNKLDKDLEGLRLKKARLQEQIAIIETEEARLAGFLEMAGDYEIKQKASPRKARQQKPAATPPQEKQRKSRKPTDKALNTRSPRFQPHRFPPAPIPEGFISVNRRTELARKIAETFPGGTVITAGDVVEKIGALWPVPAGAKTAKHHLASVMIHEKGPGAILEKIGKGRYEVKANAIPLIQSRIAAEIAQAQEAGARAQ